MKPEYEAILDRLNKLERRDRRWRAERLVMLAAIGWLLATGPAARFFSPTVPMERLSEGHKAGSAGVRSLEGLRHLLKVQPALDPQIVIEDEREAFGKPMPSPALSPSTRVAVAAQASTLQPRVPRPRSTAEPKSVASTVVVSTRRRRGARRASGLTASRRPLRRARLAAAKPPAKRLPFARRASLAAAALSISRDVEKTLPRLPTDGSLRTLALAEWPDPGALAPPLREGLTEPVAGPRGIPQLKAEAASPPSTPPAPLPPVLPATPVALKALGYAQAADGSAQIVLSDGNALFVVNEGQEFLDRFRVVSLRPEGVDVEDRLRNETIHLTFGR